MLVGQIATVTIYSDGDDVPSLNIVLSKGPLVNTIRTYIYIWAGNVGALISIAANTNIDHRRFWMKTLGRGQSAINKSLK